MQHCIYTRPTTLLLYIFQTASSTEYKCPSWYSVCTQATCIKSTSGTFSCQQVTHPIVMAHVTEWEKTKLVSALWQKYVKPPINNNGLNGFQLLSKTNSTNKNTGFLNFVQHLVIQKEHNISKLDTFPSSTDMKGRHLLTCVQQQELFSITG